jgi:hypothetical protein
VSEQPGLVGLECVRCGTPVPAEPEEVAWICETCGQGLLLDEQAGLRSITVHFGPAGTDPGVKRMPFWIAAGHVRVTRRESFGKDSAPDRRWEHPVQFVLPAFATSVERAVAWGRHFLLNSPDLGAGEAAPLQGVTVLPEEIDSLARFVVLTIEAEGKDKLEAIDFSLDLEPAELWVLSVGTT